MAFAGAILTALAILVAALMFLLRYHELWIWYDAVRDYLARLEDLILNLPQKGFIIMAIFLLFAIKCFIPIYPTSTVCFLTGIVFPVYLAVPINIAGMTIMLTLKYFWGFRFGGGWAWKYVSRVEPLKNAVQQKSGRGNPWLLCLLRFIPGVPVNTISSIYGSMNFGFHKFLLLSLAGFFPRLVSFTLVGRNAFDPLSIGFLLPMFIILLISGISLMWFSGILILIKTITSHHSDKTNAKEVEEND